MRIIAGKFRSRKLLSPPVGATTRPIPDRVKESLFQLLRGHFEGATVLDAFAGTGAIGLEAVSRGAARVVMIERDKRTAEVIRRNIEMLGCSDEAEVVVTDMLGAAALARVPRPIDLVFFDPPYPLVTDPMGWDRVKQQFAAAVRLLADDGFAMLRTPWPFLHSPDGPMSEEAVEPARPESDPKRRRAHDERKWDWRAELERGPEPDDRAAAPDDDDDEGGPDAELVDPFEDDDEFEDGADDTELNAETDESGREHHAASADPGAERRKAVLVDLRIPGAKGPETHVYRHTGVHLYMKDTGSQGAAPPAQGSTA